MVKTLLFCSLLLVVGSMHAAKVASFPDIFKPVQLVIDDGTLYISENSILIYSMENFKLLRKIGGKGEGPAEFQTQPLINITPGHILLHSFNKIALFSRDGKLLKEKKFSNMTIGPVERIGENYVVNFYSFTEISVAKIVLFDKNFEEIRTLYSYKMPVPKIEGGKEVLRLLGPHVSFRCYREKIYIVDGYKGFYIESFDLNGNSLGVIRQKFPKVKVSEQFKAERIKNFLRSFNDFDIKRIKKRFEFRFPEYFPEFGDFSICDGKFYVKTYRNEKGLDEYIILDLKGKKIGNVWLPQTSPKGYYFYNNGFYFLKENEDEEVWELHFQNLGKGKRG